MNVRVNVVLNRTVVDSDWRFDNLCVQIQNWFVSRQLVVFYLVINLIDKLSLDVILLAVCKLSRVVIGYEDS